MVSLTAHAHAQGKQMVLIYCDSMDAMPQLQADILAAGGKIELVSGQKKPMLRDIARLYRKYRPEVVDVHFSHPAKMLCELLSLFYGTKHFTHVHSLLGDADQYKVQKGILRRTAVGIYYALQERLSHRVLCISQAIFDQYTSWSYASQNTHTLSLLVAYVGTPLRPSCYTHTQARTLCHIPQSVKVLCNVSAIEPIKGIDTILHSLALLIQSGEDIAFVHIGGLRNDTPQEQQYALSLRTLAHDLGIADRVYWLGKRTDVQDVFPLADIYVHPSRSEGLGCVLMEAAVAGLPLVATQVGGIPEVVNAPDGGILVPPDDPTALANAIRAVLHYPSQLSADTHTTNTTDAPSQIHNTSTSSSLHPMGLSAQSYVYSRFDQNRCAQQLFHLYYS